MALNWIAGEGVFLEETGEKEATLSYFSFCELELVQQSAPREIGAICGLSFALEVFCLSVLFLGTKTSPTPADDPYGKQHVSVGVKEYVLGL